MFIIRGVFVYGGIVPVEPFVAADPVPSREKKIRQTPSLACPLTRITIDHRELTDKTRTYIQTIVLR
jgi:hypothetical protein